MKMMNKKTILLGLMTIALLLLAGCAGKAQIDSSTVTGASNADIIKKEVPQANSAYTEPVDREIKITSSRWKFTPSVITVKQGEKIKLIGDSSDVPHGLAIPDFGVNLYMNGLTPSSKVFTADKTGTFQMYCSVPCGAGHSSMRGTLIVE